MYGCKVNVTTPLGHVGGETGLIGQTWNLRSLDYPANVDLENPSHLFYPLPANSMHGESKEVHLDIRIIKCT